MKNLMFSTAQRFFGGYAAESCCGSAMLVSYARYGAAVKRGLDVWNNGEGTDTVTEHIYIAIIYEAVHAYSPDHLISKQASCMYKSLKKPL